MDDRQTPAPGESTADTGDPADAVVQTNVSDDVAENGAVDDAAGLQVDVGVLVAHSPNGDSTALRSFAERMVRDGVDGLATATDVTWRVHCAEPDPLTDGTPRRPSEFLDEAAHHMVKQPCDLVVVVTDVPLISRGEKSVAGLASPLSRVVVVSIRRLLREPGRTSGRSLDSEPVRWNAGTLLLHLLGHVFGAGHGDGDVMEPFSFDPSRQSVPSFDADVREHLRSVATGAPEEAVSRGPVRRLAFHGLSLVRNPSTVASTLLHSRAPLIPLSLPRLSTAAVTPTLILVFSAEA